MVIIFTTTHAMNKLEHFQLQQILERLLIIPKHLQWTCVCLPLCHWLYLHFCFTLKFDFSSYSLLMMPIWMRGKSLLLSKTEYVFSQCEQKVTNRKLRAVDTECFQQGEEIAPLCSPVLIVSAEGIEAALSSTSQKKYMEEKKYSFLWHTSKFKKGNPKRLFHTEKNSMGTREHTSNTSVSVWWHWTFVNNSSWPDRGALWEMELQGQVQFSTDRWPDLMICLIVNSLKDFRSTV